MSVCFRGLQRKRAMCLCAALLALLFAGAQAFSESSCADLLAERAELTNRLIQLHIEIGEARLVYPAAKRAAAAAVKAHEEAVEELNLALRLYSASIQWCAQLREKECSGDAECAIYRLLLAQAGDLETKARERYEKAATSLGAVWGQAIVTGLDLWRLEQTLKYGDLMIWNLARDLDELGVRIAAACSGPVED